MPEQPTNVLICSAGRRVSLVRYFQAALRAAVGPDARVVCIDLAPRMSAACQVADVAEPIGRFASPDYIPSVIELCLRHRIGLVVPTIDTELALLARSRAAFEAAGIHVVVSDEALVARCRDKRETLKWFTERGIAVPEPVDPARPAFPFFAKPVAGSSSNDLHVIRGPEDVFARVLDPDVFIHQRYLSPRDHDEYTLDLYYDRGSRLRAVIPRLRLETRGGEVSKGLTTRNALVPFVRERLSTLEGARGCLTLQLFMHRESGAVYGIELNPRFGGGYPLSREAGADFPRWLVDEYLLGRPVADFDDWQDNLLLLRYDTEHVVRAD